MGTDSGVTDVTEDSNSTQRRASQTTPGSTVSTTAKSSNVAEANDHARAQSEDETTESSSSKPCARTQRPVPTSGVAMSVTSRHFISSAIKRTILTAVLPFLMTNVASPTVATGDFSIFPCTWAL